MQRWATTLVGFAVVVLAVWLVARDYRAPKAIGHAAEPSLAERDAGDAGGLMFALGDAAASAMDDGGSGLLVSDLLPPETDHRVDGGIGTTLPDGSQVPPLPNGIPRQVRFGVVLISYVKAQPSVAGGRPSTRSREEAKVLAEKLLTTAQEDFHAAVQQGDSGSSDDLGRVKLGILEPAPEYVLFTLPVAGIGGPVDTPRGYWIVKRLE
jgi:hypothetical protein